MTKQARAFKQQRVAQQLVELAEHCDQMGIDMQKSLASAARVYACLTEGKGTQFFGGNGIPAAWAPEFIEEKSEDNKPKGTNEKHDNAKINN